MDKKLQELGLVSRYAGNPILSAQTSINWANIKIYNPAICYQAGKVHMIFRAIGDDWISRLGYASSLNSTDFTIHPEPIFQPSESYESEGTEDPRITYIDGQYVLAYTAYDGKCARLTVATSHDLYKWRRHGPILPDWSIGFWQSISKGQNNWSKAGALIPEKINGKYIMLFGDHNIWPAYSSDLQTWEHSEDAVLSPRDGYFDAGYVEMGPPPIKTKKGWLVLYHGVQRLDDIPGDQRVYRLGAALLDIDNPAQVVWQSCRPLLEPKDNEKIGIVDAFQYEGGFNHIQNISTEELQKKVSEGESPLAIFCCGAFMKDSQVYIYYSSMDTAINLATISLEDILKH